MTTPKKKKEKKITPQKARAFIKRKVNGEQVKDIAKDMDISVKTVSRHVADFDEYLGESNEWQDAAQRIVKMLTSSCDVYEDHLSGNSRGMPGNPDLMAARDILKATAFLKERQKVEKSYSALSDSELADLKEQIFSDADKD